MHKKKRKLSPKSVSLVVKAMTVTNGRLMSSLCVSLTMMYRRSCQDRNFKREKHTVVQKYVLQINRFLELDLNGCFVIQRAE